MYRRYLSVVLLIFVNIVCFNLSAVADNVTDPQVGTTAKGTYLKAVLLDSLNRTPIEFATMSAKYIGEKTASRYALSDEKGVVIIQGMKVGRASVTIEYMGYKTRHLTIDIKKGANDAGEVLLQEDINLLGEVVVSGVANPIVIKRDTIEYNASSFKINETDMLEELIKKLPGIEIGTDGSITANGKTINKVMIDGKTFFLDDPTLATKNLPAKIVEKVRIVERKSDQARFTGIDDGEEETVLDLGIKAGMMRGWFGNLAGGYGTDNRFEAGAMIGRFNDKTQISIIGNGNNTNNRGFTDMAGSMMGGMRGGRGFWGGNKGITTSWMGGVNANTEVLDGAMKLSGNALYSGSEQDVKETKNKTTMLANGSNMYTGETSTDFTTTDGFRFGGEIEYDISESASLLFRPNINIGGGSFKSENDYYTLTDTDSTNRGHSNNYGDNDSQQFGGTLLWRQRLGKPGRTISIRLNYDYSNNDLVGYNYSETRYFQNNMVDSLGIIDQKYIQNEKSNSIGGRLSYTEPLGKNFFVEAAYRYNYKKTNSDKDTYNAIGKDGDMTIYDEANPVAEYTTHYENIFINQQAELNFKKQEDRYNLTVGMSMQPSTTTSKGTDRDTTYSIINFAPAARFDYRFTDDKFLRVRYRGRTSQPSINQLMPISDNTNPLQRVEGNENLNPEFSHNLGVEYRTNNRSNFSWFSTSLDASYTTDKIVSKKYYTDEGVQISTYDNTNKGVYSLSGRIMFNSVIAQSNFSISSFSNIRYGNGISYVQDGNGNSANGMSKPVYVENVTRTLSVNENLRITYRNDWAEVIVGGRVSYQDAWYTVETMDKVATWSNAVTGSVNFTIPGGINFTSDINHNFYIGYDDQAGQPSTMWNASLSKTLFKNSATLKVKVYDILKEAKNLTRTTTENYIQDVINNTLGQYVMVTFTWRFGNFGDMKKMRGPGGRGGMGRGPMGPPPGGFGPRM